MAPERLDTLYTCAVTARQLVSAPFVGSRYSREWIEGRSAATQLSPRPISAATTRSLAARSRASHFNDETAWESLAYGAMAVGAVAIVAGSFIVGLLILIWRSDSKPRSGASVGAGLGLVLGSIGTLFVGAALGSSDGHWIGGERTDASGLPFFGWSTTGGDLRVPHFFATHAMQVLPLFGLVVDRLSRSIGRFAVPPFAAAYGCVVLAT